MKASVLKKLQADKQGAASSLAAAKETSVDATVAAVGRQFRIKKGNKEQHRKAFLSGQHVFASVHFGRS